MQALVCFALREDVSVSPAFATPPSAHLRCMCRGVCQVHTRSRRRNGGHESGTNAGGQHRPHEGGPCNTASPYNIIPQSLGVRQQIWRSCQVQGQSSRVRIYEHPRALRAHQQAVDINPHTTNNYAKMLSLAHFAGIRQVENASKQLTSRYNDRR